MSGCSGGEWEGNCFATFSRHDNLPFMEKQPAPEFGPNGAVLNSPTMGDRLRRKYQGERFPPGPRVPEHWVWRLITVVMICAVLLLVADQGPPWVRLVPALFVAARYVREFWPMGKAEWIIWFILHITVFSPLTYFLFFS